MTSLPVGGNPRRPVGRRGFLGLALAGVVGTAAGVALPQPAAALMTPDLDLTPDNATIAFHGEHQAGIATRVPALAAFVSYSLLPTTDAEALGRLLRVWTGTIEALMAGRPAPGDPTPHLSTPATGLTVTIGVGARTVALAGGDQAEPLLTLPSFAIDALEPRWSGGDLVAQVCADDATALAHACRILTRDAAPFARPRWHQSGFSGARPDGTSRNLLGHVEGPGNPAPGTAGFDSTVWSGRESPTWLIGGTTMVIRRIRLGMDAWDRLPEPAQDQVIGRRALDGAPLGRTMITDAPDFEAIDASGPTTHVHGDGEIEKHAPGEAGPAIAEDAHIRRAHPSFNDGRTIFRRGFSYAENAGDHGLLFVSFQRELESYIRIQDSLATLDALNRWTTPVGSASFAVLPGCERGDWLGRALVEG